MEPEPLPIIIADSIENLITLCIAHSVVLFVGRALMAEFFLYNGVQHARLFQAVAPQNALPGSDEYNGVCGAPSPIVVPLKLYKEANEELGRGLESQLRKVVSLTVTRTFVYIDISDFSTYPASHQHLIINSLIKIAKSIQNSKNYDVELEAKLCIGDGYIFVFPNPVPAVMFAALLASRIRYGSAEGSLPIDFHFRISAHIGPVFRFWDIGRNEKGNPPGDWNYVGDGINGGARVLEVMGKDIDDVIYVSDQLLQKIRTMRRNEQKKIVVNLENRGRRKDKHSLFWRVHQLSFERLITELNDPTERRVAEIERERKQEKLERPYGPGHVSD